MDNERNNNPEIENIDNQSYPLPPWISLWVSKLADSLDYESISSYCFGDEEELDYMFKQIGKTFVNLFTRYKHYYDENEYKLCEFDNPMFKIIDRQLTIDLEQRIKDYEKICDKNRSNGKKGGRPSTKENPSEPKET